MNKNEFIIEIERFISEYIERKGLKYSLAKETVYFINGEEEYLYLQSKNIGKHHYARGRGISTEELFVKHKKGLSMELITNKFMIDAGDVRKENEEELDEYMDKIGAVLISKKRNTEYLRKKPHRPFLDLAITYQIMLKNGDRIDCTPVTGEIMKKYHLSEEEMHKKALLYLRENFQSKIEREGRAIRLSNEMGKLGAAALLDRELLDKLAKELSSDLVIIPTSLHEVHAFPLKEINIEKVIGVIMSLREISEPADFLSENYYIYDSDYKKLEIGIIKR